MISNTTIPPTMPTNFHRYLKTRPLHERWILGHVLAIPANEMTSLIHSIATGNFALGSDGSKRGIIGSYSRRIQSLTNGTTFAVLHSRAKIKSTLQAEAFGHLSCLYLLRAILASHNIVPETDLPPIKSYIDNLGLIQRLYFGPDYSIKHTQQNCSDLIHEINAVAASLPFVFERCHVRSHQYDKVTNLDDIPFPSRLNKACDVAADQAYTCTACPKSVSPTMFPSTKAYVIWNDDTFSTNVANRLRYANMDTALRDYITKKASWTSTEFDAVAWDFIHQVMYRASSDERKAYTKLQHRLWATNEVLWIRTQRKHDHRCNRCSRYHETFEHVFRCPSDDANTARTSALSTLRIFLQNKRLAAPMISSFCTGIEQWLMSNTHCFSFPPDQYDDEVFQSLRIAFDSQTSLGWDHLLRGRISKAWFHAHDIYCQQRHLSAHYHSDQLGPSLIRALWHFSLWIWNNRNNFIHGTTTQDTLNYQLQRLDKKIQLAYARQDAIEDIDDHTILFSMPLEERLIQTHTAKLKWYLLYESCLHAPSIELQPDDSIPENKPLHEFFRAYPAYTHSSDTNANPPT